MQEAPRSFAVEAARWLPSIANSMIRSMPLRDRSGQDVVQFTEILNEEAVLLSRILWLWSISSVVCEGKGLVLAVRRVRFMIRAVQVRRALAPMIEASKHSALGRLIEKRPETIGAVVWPYQCAGWGAETRLVQICEHFAEIERVGRPLDFEVDEQLSLLNLREIREGLYVVVDQAKWFMREGQLVINLFVGEVRIFSLAFSLGRDGGELAAFSERCRGATLKGWRTNIVN